MIKLIVSDIDGTLLQNGIRKLSPEFFEYIGELKKRGIFFAAASGRQIANLERLFEPIKDDIAYIGENGALVMLRGEVISKTALDRKIGEEILRDIREYGDYEILLSGAETSYLEPKQKEYEEHMKFFVKNNVTVVEDITKVEEEFLKISVYGKDGVGLCESHFNECFGDRVTVVTSGYKWLDMIAKGVNKGNALKLLMSRLDIRPDEVLAFGDNYNDVEMLKAVSYSCAMTSSQPGIAEQCYMTADTVEEVLKRLIDQEAL